MREDNGKVVRWCNSGDISKVIVVDRLVVVVVDKIKGIENCENSHARFTLTETADFVKEF